MQAKHIYPSEKNTRAVFLLQHSVDTSVFIDELCCTPTLKTDGRLEANGQNRAL